MGIAMQKLTDLQNIGREMERKLTAVGIDSPGKLVETGAEQAFFRLKTAYPEVCLVHLYALEGAVCGMAYNPAGRTEKRAESVQRFAVARLPMRGQLGKEGGQCRD